MSPENCHLKFLVAITVKSFILPHATKTKAIFQGWIKKIATRNSTTLETKDPTNSHPVWEAIKSVKPKVSSRDCCRGLKDSGSGATAVKTAPALPKSAECLVSMGISVDGGCHLSQAQQLHSPSALCFGWWKSNCFQLSVWYEPTPVYLLRRTFQCVIRCPLGHHLRRIDRSR